MYLLRSRTNSIAASSAILTFSSRTRSMTRLGNFSAAVLIPSSRSFRVPGAGSTPPRYFWIMLTVRDSRLPRSLARSAFWRLIRMLSP